MNEINPKVLELLNEQGVNPDSPLGKELITKYETSLKKRQNELQELEEKILNMAEDDFLKSIKN